MDYGLWTIDFPERFSDFVFESFIELKHSFTYQLSIFIEIGISTIAKAATCQDIIGPNPSVFLDKWCKYIEILCWNANFF